jgi:hypothetical protein
MCLSEGGRNLKKKSVKFYKPLILGVIVLFIGVAVQPAFAINIKSSNDLILKNELEKNDLVEYIIQIVRTDEIIEHKVFLTEEEVKNLESLFEKIKTDLNNSESREETIQIYNDAAEFLRNFKLLPEDVSVDEIKQLITGSNRDLDKIRFKNEMGDGFENRLCFVTGKSSKTFSFGPILLFSLFYFIPIFSIIAILNDIVSLFNISRFPIFEKIYNAFVKIFIGISIELPLILVLSSILCVIPVSLGSIMTFGTHHSLPPWYYYDYPSEGWIDTRGLNGKQSYNGNFYGQLGRIPVILAGYYIGITGFTGINILDTKNNKVFYIGFALNVKIDSRP